MSAQWNLEWTRVCLPKYVGLMGMPTQRLPKRKQNNIRKRIKLRLISKMADKTLPWLQYSRAWEHGTISFPLAFASSWLTRLHSWRKCECNQLINGNLTIPCASAFVLTFQQLALQLIPCLNSCSHLRLRRAIRAPHLPIGEKEIVPISTSSFKCQ